ncbi:MAG: hypothetical protein HYV05_09245 [Deltaproteobacteria bacterium]|nr:hypothetical protein [Deltaproteobacteria bacterium]MBI2348823.1 hypothetical protein [Deltaproteobacteria bacterium]MBI2539335.1 hypothetical protein [Deltaproteobacteria bacterium]MBI2990749.1 hypothetical protein [Deltaproteobacteria bacterium]MBI3061425.1 hypothetical protein [Deltaproteobacteria bacterium]
MKILAAVIFSLCMTLALNAPARGQEFKKWEAKIAEHKRWLDSLGPHGSKFWISLDSKSRPHRLYLGEGFFHADARTQERFVETYSSYLAGHPEKFALIDLFDSATRREVGEFGWGGFKLYGQSARGGKTARTPDGRRK